MARKQTAPEAVEPEIDENVLADLDEQEIEQEETEEREPEQERFTHFPMIYSAICATLADVGPIGKNKRSKDSSGREQYNYRSIDDVMNALSPAMARNGIFMVPEILENHREWIETAKGYKMQSVVMKVKYTFFAEDGSSISCTVIGEARDAGDKASNKAMAIAMKYACFQVFCIPTEEMRLMDPDATVQDVVPNNTPPVENKPNRVTYIERIGKVIGIKSLATKEEQDKFAEALNQAKAAKIVPDIKLKDMSDQQIRQIAEYLEGEGSTREEGKKE